LRDNRAALAFGKVVFSSHSVSAPFASGAIRIGE